MTRFFFIILICSVFFSCKNEVKSTVENADRSTVEPVTAPIPKKKELTPKLEGQVKSVMVKSMITPELKTFSSFLVTIGLGDMLSKKDGPFTIIGPSNEAFNSLSQLKMRELQNTANKEELVRLIKSHVIEGYLDSAVLANHIKEGNGTYKIISLSGETYIASTDGTAIVITDAKGEVAQIEKSDITGANGVVHVLNKVLGVN